MPFLPLLVPLAAPQTRETLVAPAGWRSVAMKNGLTSFVPEGLEPGRLVAMIFWPVESAPGDLKAWFVRRAREMGANADKILDRNGVLATTGTEGARPYFLVAARPAHSGNKARIGMLLADGELLSTYGPDLFALMIRDSGSVPRAPAEAPVASAKDPDWANLPASDPAKPLPAASSGGAKVFVRYHNDRDYATGLDTMRTETLILFPDGAAFEGGPYGPVASFDPANLRQAALPGRAGRWSVSGDRMTLDFPERGTGPVAYRRIGDGWTASKEATEPKSLDVYNRAISASMPKLQGEWRTDSLFTSGVAGGPAPTIAVSSSGTLAFRGDRFADATTRFLSATSPDASIAGKGGRSGGGRYRLDGLLLTREKNGRRGVELCFLLPYWSEGEPNTLWISGRRYDRPKE